MFTLKIDQLNAKSLSDLFGQVARGVFTILSLVVLISSVSNQAWAGCGCPHQDGWYQRASTNLDGTNHNSGSRFTQSRLVYVDGYLQFATITMPPRCSGPECRQNDPNQSLPMVPTVVIDSNSPLFAGRSIFLNSNPLVVDSIRLFDDISSIANPDGIERPPRSIVSC